MGDPKTKVPAKEQSTSPYAYGEGTNACMAPPAFDPQAGGESSMYGSEEPNASFAPNPNQPAACMDGDPDPVAGAIGKAVNNTDHAWGRKTIASLESTLIATRNILQGSENPNPLPGSLHHYGTYEGWDIKKGPAKALKNLFQAMHSGESGKKRLRYLRKAKGGLKGVINQVKRFSKSKKFGEIPGFKELQQIVETDINGKIDAVQTAIEATMPVSERPSTRKRYGGKSVSRSRGFNKQKIADHTKLPGLAAPQGPAPAEGSMAAQVEANMAADFEIVDASIEDWLYVNLPELIAGKGKMKGASKVWYLIRNYRNNILNPLYGAHVKDPENAEKKKAYQDALANMEKEIGPQVRKIARGWWATEVGDITDLHKESEEIDQILKSANETLTQATSDPEFDPATFDKAGLLDSLSGLSKRIQGIRKTSQKVGLGKSDVKYCLNKGWISRQETARAVRILKKKKLTAGRFNTLSGHISKALGSQQLLTGKLNASKTAAEEKNKSLKDVIDRINDPEQTPLVKEVKKHKVSVKFTGKEGNATHASYNTKPESRIGIYEDTWSPMGISDQKGSFKRPKGGERGAQVYRDLKNNHGFPEGEAKVLGSVAVGEGDFHSLNSVDVMRISLGFIQFAGASFVGLLKDLKNADSGYFKNHFEKYGILINDGSSKMPKITQRDERFKPGEQIDKPKEERNRSLNKLVVYDHQKRVWVKGLEAMAVLQSDPRYLTLIQSSAGDAQMKLAQVKRARRGYLHPVRNATASYEYLGLEDPDIPEGSKKKSKKRVRIKDVMNNEVAMYAATAWGIAAGPSKGKRLARKFLRGFIKEKGIKTYEELKKINQSELAEYVRRTHKSKTWSRSDKLGQALGNPLSKSDYIGNP